MAKWLASSSIPAAFGSFQLEIHRADAASTSLCWPHEKLQFTDQEHRDM